METNIKVVGYKQLFLEEIEAMKKGEWYKRGFDSRYAYKPDIHIFPIYIGRANSRKGLKASPLRNPHILKGASAKDPEKRKAIVEHYRKCLEAKVNPNPNENWDVIECELKRIERIYRSGEKRYGDNFLIELVCHCKIGNVIADPAIDCHGDVILDMLEARIK